LATAITRTGGGSPRFPRAGLGAACAATTLVGEERRGEPLTAAGPERFFEGAAGAREAMGFVTREP
jgi:hypothetical protein